MMAPTSELGLVLHDPAKPPDAGGSVPNLFYKDLLMSGKSKIADFVMEDSALSSSDDETDGNYQKSSSLSVTP